MKKNIQAESFAGIIIAVFILGITLLWISNIVAYSQQSLSEISQKKDLQWLSQTANILSEKLDSSSVTVWEDFYLYKNTSTNNYQIFTGAWNQNYQYINKNGEYVSDIASYSWAVYSRVFVVSSRSALETWNYDIIDFTIKPVLNR